MEPENTFVKIQCIYYTTQHDDTKKKREGRSFSGRPCRSGKGREFSGIREAGAGSEQGYIGGQGGNEDGDTRSTESDGEERKYDGERASGKEKRRALATGMGWAWRGGQRRGRWWRVEGGGSDFLTKGKGQAPQIQQGTRKRDRRHQEFNYSGGKWVSQIASATEKGPERHKNPFIIKIRIAPRKGVVPCSKNGFPGNATAPLLFNLLFEQVGKQAEVHRARSTSMQVHTTLKATALVLIDISTVK
ncbi:hypothetical protein BDK51DRAFT_27589 [Blyttiomyces helicus]|uniref:Uncharacterized protein n=1 Tax=Blyttiomyces helicus TaxID=388810 RepID=A0A4P9WMU1_9FUNG|nr:hypothetical protein BDK51DRAFT_27589 [Blyttiomyces helicus]|eukprot:RKO94244.1 hypothetical protein BDK51DRAFT_27589 [Blyttiomyces helicus]